MHTIMGFFFCFCDSILLLHITLLNVIDLIGNVCNNNIMKMLFYSEVHPISIHTPVEIIFLVP